MLAPLSDDTSPPLFSPPPLTSTKAQEHPRHPFALFIGNVDDGEVVRRQLSSTGRGGVPKAPVAHGAGSQSLGNDEVLVLRKRRYEYGRIQAAPFADIFSSLVKWKAIASLRPL